LKPASYIAGAILALIAAAPACAAVTVFGGGLAQECSVAALAGKYDGHSESLCTDALNGEVLEPFDRAGTLVNRGVMKLRRGEYEAAHADFDASIRLEPALGEAWVNRGAMYVGEHQYRAGLEDITRGLKMGTKEPEKAYYNRALAYEGLDDEKAAYLDYQQALNLRPGWDLPQKELLRFTVTHR
jgi:tetratricopeptide (TPR) repeat protein